MGNSIEYFKINTCWHKYVLKICNFQAFQAKPFVVIQSKVPIVNDKLALFVSAKRF